MFYPAWRGATTVAVDWAKRVLTAGLAAAGILALAAPAQAVPAQRDEPRLLAVAPPVLFEDNGRWVHAIWLGTETVCQFRLTADGQDLQVGYPANTATYTSFYSDDALSRLEPDYTALYLTAGRAGTVPMRMHLAYRHLRPDQSCVGPVRHRTLTVRLSVLAAWQN